MYPRSLPFLAYKRSQGQIGHVHQESDGYPFAESQGTSIPNGDHNKTLIFKKGLP